MQGDGISGQTILAFFHSLWNRWGEEWVVDRLIELASRGENDWLEFKATMSPPHPYDMDIYSDKGNAKQRNGLPKTAPGDYILHVMKALVAFANSGSGGIVLLGVANDLTPAKSEALCPKESDLPQNMDVFSGELHWDTDRWEQHIHKILRSNSFEDKYKTRWTCSVDMDQRIEFKRGVFHRHPVLILIVSPEERPIWLTREIVIGVKNCPWKEAGKLPKGKGCHFPHDPPPLEKVIHIYKRGNASNDEWGDPQYLLDHWDSRPPWYSLLNVRDNNRFVQFSNNDISYLGAFSALRSWSFSAVAKFLAEKGENIEEGGPSPDFSQNSCCCFYGDQVKCEISAGILCRNLLYTHELKKQLPLFLKTLTPNWLEVLAASTRNFFKNQLTAMGKGRFNVKNIDFFGRNGNLQFIIPAPEFPSSDVAELWWRAVRSLKNEFYNSSIVLFCPSVPEFVPGCGISSIPLEELNKSLHINMEKEENDPVL